MYKKHYSKVCVNSLRYYLVVMQNVQSCWHYLMRALHLHRCTLSRWDVQYKVGSLAATATVQILRGMADDTEVDDDEVKALSYALARELGSIIKIVEALEINPMDSARMLLDGPY
jgi:hypothetical protein